MMTTYTVTTDKSVFRKTLLEVFPERELLTMMSIIVCYSDARKAVSEDAFCTTIDYYELCKNAKDDGIEPAAIKNLLERLSVAR
jgi:hypothetical protein